MKQFLVFHFTDGKLKLKESKQVIYRKSKLLKITVDI